MKKLRKLAWGNGGAEIAEFAVVLPILFALLFAIFSFGRAYNIYSTVTRAAQEGARVAATPVCVSCPRPVCAWDPFPCDDTISDSVTAVLTASHIDPAQIAQLPQFPSAQSCPSPAPAPQCTVSASQITICRNVVLNPKSSSQECGAIVSFQYPYRFLSLLNLQMINIPARAQTRMEY